ncbi:hypothetical protein QQ054_19340 [Oscillatoria amoena NRMC-F 0135]|nr:hypothetical protein [Oscillatoria laete-virens]MDL5048173.1 hypothetical protein [Oscillatoria amoena NRMC-F 0135]MDL5053065.1 hypothetical protein [Oscillatoria laete-virens NRMC-F 0139]
MKRIIPSIFCAAALMLSGCGEKNPPQFQAQPRTAAPPAALPEAPQAPTLVRGTVLETMNAAGYTYIQATDSSGQKIWMAIPETRVKVGAQIEFSYSREQLMSNFHSKTFNRTFDQIYFLPGVKIVGTTPEVL